MEQSSSPMASLRGEPLGDRMGKVLRLGEAFMRMAVGMTQRQRRTYARKMRMEALDVQTHVTPH